MRVHSTDLCRKSRHGARCLATRSSASCESRCQSAHRTNTAPRLRCRSMSGGCIMSTASSRRVAKNISRDNACGVDRLKASATTRKRRRPRQSRRRLPQRIEEPSGGNGTASPKQNLKEAIRTLTQIGVSGPALDAALDLPHPANNGSISEPTPAADRTREGATSDY